jgi:cytochrome c oxidase cbb3-type subunit 3
MQVTRIVTTVAVLVLPGLALVAAPGAQQSPPARASTGDSVRFVPHAEHVPAGFPSRDRPLALKNPHEGDANAAKLGAQLFVSYNCIDCHGADGAGAMGPSLADGRWHFGGSPAELFESIYQGRPDGMPSWGGRIADDQIWMLVTYVRSLSAGKDVSTENFTGRTVERTGH